MNRNALTNAETARLAILERKIRDGIATFFEVGQALEEIRSRRLYRETFDTFEDYCRKQWKISRVHAHRLVAAAGVVQDLLPIGNKTPGVPVHESQARELVPLPAEQRREVWEQATQETEQPTAERLQQLTLEAIRSLSPEQQLAYFQASEEKILARQRREDARSGRSGGEPQSQPQRRLSQAKGLAGRIEAFLGKLSGVLLGIGPESEAASKRLEKVQREMAGLVDEIGEIDMV